MADPRSETTPVALPCPFCGGAVLTRNGVPQHQWIECGGCGAEGPVADDPTASEIEVAAAAVALWNRAPRETANG